MISGSLHYVCRQLAAWDRPRHMGKRNRTSFRVPVCGDTVLHLEPIGPHPLGLNLLSKSRLLHNNEGYGARRGLVGLEVSKYLLQLRLAPKTDRSILAPGGLFFCLAEHSRLEKLCLSLPVSSIVLVLKVAELVLMRMIRISIGAVCFQFVSLENPSRNSGPRAVPIANTVPPPPPPWQSSVVDNLTTRTHCSPNL